MSVTSTDGLPESERRPRPIPLVRTSEIQPMLQTLRDIGSPVGQILCRAGVPEAVEGETHGFLPHTAVLRLLAQAAASESVPGLSWSGVQSARPHELGTWGVPVARSATLRDALRAFREYFPHDVPLTVPGFEVGARHTWFWRYRPTRAQAWVGEEQGQQYALASLVRVVRFVAGDDWLPPRIQIESPEMAWLDAIPDLARSIIDLGRPAVAIAIPNALLDRPLKPASSCDFNTVAGAEMPAGSLSQSLRQALETLLPQISPTIEIGSELAGLSPRTLRRQLASEGSGWRRVVDEARIRTASRQLEETSRPLASIAMNLAYSDQSSFSRAFHRWMGETPSAYRLRRARERADLGHH